MRIFSGIRPTGDLHIGNYLGAMKQWIALQEENDCIYCIVDLHAITTPYKKEELQENIIESAVAYLAAGLNPEKSIIFVQSQVKEHSELAWLLETITPLGELKRMTQFKDKSKKHPEYINAGLLNYPVLMASDILLYQTEKVPVGEDQKQHVELARTIARKFNNRFGETFTLPEALISKHGARIKSLQSPKQKMSKTGDQKGCINLFDNPETIRGKIMSAVTDTGKEIAYKPRKKPAVSNLLQIYSLFSERPIPQIEKEFNGKGYAQFKKSLSETVIEALEPIQRKRKELLKREVYVREILTKGQKKAQLIAQSTMEKVKKRMGLI